jgi:hypothetical protein
MLLGVIKLLRRHNYYYLKCYKFNGINRPLLKLVKVRSTLYTIGLLSGAAHQCCLGVHDRSYPKIRRPEHGEETAWVEMGSGRSVSISSGQCDGS